MVARTAGALAWSVLASPPPRAAVPVSGVAPPLPADRPIRVLSWNVQFCAGRSRKFFYDGGDAVHVPDVDVIRTLDRIGAVLREVDADLVLLQEVDRGSDRTSRIDQHLGLLHRAPYPVHASTPYYRNPYVPYPPIRHLGRMDMHLSVLSRFGVAGAARWQLPMLHESWLRQQFNLRRAVLSVDVARPHGAPLRVMDVHLSAFSRGDGTLPRQVEAVEALLEATDALAMPWLLAGDFNALPPGDDPARLGPDAALYSDEGCPIATLFERTRSAVPAEAHQREPARWRTWLPHGERVADRAIDHLFVADAVRVEEVRVLAEVDDVSDHLPLLVSVRIP